jgi:superfamily II DNA or RNA helicase
MLYKHQLDIIREDKTKCGIFIGTGGGKTLIALSLARGKTLVVCPKTQKLDGNWERENEKNKLNVNLTVMSKEEFRRDHQKLPRFNTLIIDEAHTCLGVTPNVRQRNKVIIPRTSQLFEALEYYLQAYRPTRFYMCTATPIRSPMTVWGAARLLGHKIDFYAFRAMFYVRLPMPGREVWTPKNDSTSKDKIANIVRKIGYIGRLEDFFDVPAQTYKTIHVELIKKQQDRIKEMRIEYPEPIVRVGKINQIENGVLSGDEFSAAQIFDNAKIEKILDLALEFPRMIIFAKYRAQIDEIHSKLHEAGYRVFTMTGDVKDRGSMINLMKGLDKYIFVVQAQISAGWELPECPVMVFASRTYSWVDYEQAIGRIQRVNNIKKNLYINLVVKGGVDEAIDKSLLNKKDFSERVYLGI